MRKLNDKWNIINYYNLPITLSLLELSISSELVETLQEYIPPWALLTFLSWNLITEPELTRGCRLPAYFVSNSWGLSQWNGRNTWEMYKVSILNIFQCWNSTLKKFTIYLATVKALKNHWKYLFHQQWYFKQCFSLEIKRTERLLVVLNDKVGLEQKTEEIFLTNICDSVIWSE